MPNGMIVIDHLGRYLGEHTCDPTNRHLCVAATRRAKIRAQTFAFTTEHPAYVIYAAFRRHLGKAENVWVDEQAPGNGLIK